LKGSLLGACSEKKGGFLSRDGGMIRANVQPPALGKKKIRWNLFFSGIWKKRRGRNWERVGVVRWGSGTFQIFGLGERPSRLIDFLR